MELREISLHNMQAKKGAKQHKEAVIFLMHDMQFFLVQAKLASLQYNMESLYQTKLN